MSGQSHLRTSPVGSRVNYSGRSVMIPRQPVKPTTSELFKELVEQRQYQQAIALLNDNIEELQGSASYYFDDEDFIRALLNYGSNDILLLLGNKYAGDSPELLQALAGRGADVLNHVNQNRLYDILWKAIVNNEDDEQTVIRLLLAAGLNPNIYVNGDPIFLTALEHHNYAVMQLLMSTPGFVMQPEFVAAVDKQLAPLLAFRQQMISQFGVPEPQISAKRGRWE